MNEPWQALVPFFSRLQLERIGSLRRARDAPAGEGLQGAVLFLDIVGFTSVTEKLGELGPKGAEVLSGVLQSYFSPVLDTIRDHGGDVLFFAGDALGVLWKARSDTEEDLRDAAVRAAQCALEAQSTIRTIEPPWGSPLKFRASLGAGPLQALEIGGENGLWMEMVRGDALERARRADEVAEAEQVVLSEPYGELLGSHRVVTAPLEGGHLRLLALPSRIEPRGLPDVELAADKGQLLQRRLPEVLATRISARPGDSLAEFRQITVLFTNILPPGAGAAMPSNLETLQDAVVAAQRQVDRFEGILYQLLEDDKGTCLIAAFGLPGTSHADDPTRALLAGRAIHHELTGLGLEPTVGVATGQVFSGVHGARHRCRYSVMGSAVNLAARLMTMAGGRGILCDGATRKLAGPRIGFEEAGWTTPKGFPAPVPIFEPREELEPAPTHTEERLVVGRAREVDEIGRAMDDVLRDGKPRLLVIRAEPGMGKSTLMETAERLAGERPIEYALGMADSFETDTAYFAFRSLARRWFGIEPGIDADEGLKRATAELEDATDLLPLVPLLGSILGLDIPETELTLQVRGRARAENVRHMLLHVARKRAEEVPRVVGVEDGHWMDSGSWTLLDELVRSVPRTLVVLTTRPIPDPPPGLQKLLEADDTRIIDLRPLDRSETEGLIRAQLGVSEVSPAALDLVCQRAEGNPFFAREVVRSLKESGGIRIRASRVELVLDNVEAAPLPPNLEGVITSRIDRLDPPTQVTIKVASVLGRAFDASVLLDVHPDRPETETLAAQLASLENAALVTHERSGGEYAFNHALTHEAVYNLLSFAQRESLHRAAAERLEKEHGEKLDQVQARLGYHFRMAAMPDRAIPYLAAAGEASSDAYASRDAIELLKTVLELDEQVRGSLALDIRRARWCRLIGMAFYNRDAQVESGQWYRRAIEYAGTKPRRRLVAVLGTLLRVTLAPGTLGQQPRRELEREERDRMLEGLAAGRELSIVHLWENAPLQFALNTFNQARSARLVGPSRESADANASLGFLVSMVGLRKTGERITMRAVEVADEVGDIRQFAAVTALAGMVLTQNGRAQEGLSFFERSDGAATALRAGMYRHRPKYMRADALVWLGRYEESRDLFVDAAEFARGAEPHVTGMANSMSALTLLRQGRIEAAVNLLESPDGVPNVLEGGVTLSVVMGLGILAEARFELGDSEAALEVVREAESWLSPKDDGTAFFSSIFGHAAIARVRLAADEPGAPVGRGFRKRTPLDLSISHVGKIHRTAPGALSTLCLLKGQRAVANGKIGKARKLFRRAIEASMTATQPYELGRSLVELAKISTDPERRDLIDRAVGVFDEHGMALESGRARALLTRG